ncbi:MAG: PepSY-associated TM helix domain-containing protein [Planctomycetota bacterium]
MPARRRKSLFQKSAAVVRWLHIYISMLGFAALMFFAVTGITLNHPTWLGGSDQVVRDSTGQLPSELVQRMDRLAIAERIRRDHQLRGAVHEFEVDDYECMIVFKGPAYAADVFVDRESGEYSLSVSTSSWVGLMNDLHKGRDSGLAWSWIIDVSALLMILMSLTGIVLLLYLKRRRLSGLVAAVVGTLFLLAFVVIAIA